MDLACLYCTACGKARPADVSAPHKACECGNAAWSNVRFAPTPTAYAGIDATGAAAAALRQPGSPHLPPPA